MFPEAGHGFGTPIDYQTVEPAPRVYTPRNAVSLVRYANVIGYTECAFFGVSHPDNTRYACREIWSKYQRDTVEFYLGEAQDEIENQVGFPLAPKWIADDKYKFRTPLVVKHGYVIGSGIQNMEELFLLATVNHTNDPAIVVLPLVLQSLSGIRVFYPDTEIEIIPSNIQQIAGNIVISIPRCRLVSIDLLNNPDTGINYTNTDNFQATVDVFNVTTDESVQASLVWPHRCDNVCLSNACAEYTETACQYVEDSKLGILQIQPATYSNGGWTKARRVCCRGTPSFVRLNYVAGMEQLSKTAETAIIRLAHSKMPTEPCGCDVTQRLWKRDRRIPEVLTRDRLECPFGMSDGAWTAWKFAESLAIQKMSLFV